MSMKFANETFTLHTNANVKIKMRHKKSLPLNKVLWSEQLAILEKFVEYEGGDLVPALLVHRKCIIQQVPQEYKRLHARAIAYVLEFAGGMLHVARLIVLHEKVLNHALDLLGRFQVVVLLQVQANYVTLVHADLASN